MSFSLSKFILFQPKGFSFDFGDKVRGSLIYLNGFGAEKAFIANRDETPCPNWVCGGGGAPILGGGGGTPIPIGGGSPGGPPYFGRGGKPIGTGGTPNFGTGGSPTGGKGRAPYFGRGGGGRL